MQRIQFSCPKTQCLFPKSHFAEAACVCSNLTRSVPSPNFHIFIKREDTEFGYKKLMLSWLIKDFVMQGANMHEVGKKRFPIEKFTRFSQKTQFNFRVKTANCISKSENRWIGCAYIFYIILFFFVLRILYKKMHAKEWRRVQSFCARLRTCVRNNASLFTPNHFQPKILRQFNAAHFPFTIRITLNREIGSKKSGKGWIIIFRFSIFREKIVENAAGETARRREHAFRIWFSFQLDRFFTQTLSIYNHMPDIKKFNFGVILSTVDRFWYIPEPKYYS